MLAPIWKDFLGKRENICFKPPLLPAFKLPNTHRNMLLNVTKVITLFLAIISVLGKAKVSNKIKCGTCTSYFLLSKLKKKESVLVQGLYFKLLLIL